ncbi:MAG: right-handed parallel beta-helix repeat-containing protein [Armatimonadetes bacterium]|nr:right-handed parallel beta-helix repeat-containing protein [Armatimonadota bacterium]
MRRTWVPLTILPVCFAAHATTFWVDGRAANAADANAGTADAPWKTISRAAQAKELKPGDSVLVKTGVYREHVDINVSGEPGRPIAFAAAPDARVVIKGSEVIRGKWALLGDVKDMPEPFQYANLHLWRIQLGDEYFIDPRFGNYADKANRWVSQVFIDDDHPLQMIGVDHVYNSKDLKQMVYIGKGLADLIPQSFWWDAPNQTLWAYLGGRPEWFCIEVGVRGFALTVTKAHDVVVRGFDMRHNRQPGGQWPIASIGSCERVMMEDCRIHWADFTGLSVWDSKNCTVRGCDLSHNGATGLAMGLTEDCTIEDCALTFNNYRHFYGDWGVAAGAKCIPGNKRTTFRGCEAAWNDEAEGIWFDTDNEDIRILDNVCHDNGDCGIMFEINKGGGIIAGNLVYANHGRGIYVSGSQNTWVVGNTLAENASGIVCMTRGPGEPPRNTRVFYNLMLHNYVNGDDTTRGSDLTLEMYPEPEKRAEMGSESDYNVLADNAWTPWIRHNWNDNNPLDRWQKVYAQDAHSKQMRVEYRQASGAFRLVTQQGLDVAGPLPSAVAKVWRPKDPKRVGCDRTQWP